MTVLAPIRVVCVDDNRMLAEAIAFQVGANERLQWIAWLENSPEIINEILAHSPNVVLMDIDMPGPDPFRTVEELRRVAPSIRVLMFTAYIRQDFVDRAIDMGAWGYISKNESMPDVLDALIRVHEGEFVLTPEVLAEHHAKA